MIKQFLRSKAWQEYDQNDFASIDGNNWSWWNYVFFISTCLLYHKTDTVIVVQWD